MDLEALWKNGVFDRYADENDNLGRVVKTPKPELVFMQNVDEERGPWVLEWCCIGDQKDLFHIYTLDDHIRRNFEALLGITDAQYIASWIILGVFRTHTEANQYYRLIRENMDEGD